MDNCWSKAFLILLAIAFFPITITVFIFKSDMEIKGKLIATVLLWGGLFIASKFMPDNITDITRERPAITEESSDYSEKKTTEKRTPIIEEKEDKYEKESDYIVTSPPETEPKEEPIIIANPDSTPQYDVPSSNQEVVQYFVLNKSTGVFHYEGCTYERRMKEENKERISGTVYSLINQGYNPYYFALG